MNSYLIDKINEKVKQKDRLFIVGDFCFRGGKPMDYLKHINCQSISVTLGNHCKPKDWYSLVGTYGKIKCIDKTIEITHNNQCIFMSHYSHITWPKSHHGSWHITGHSHGKLDFVHRKIGLKILDVGVDNCENYGKPFGEPWSFEEIKTVMNNRNFIGWENILK